jgi:lipopolysaccharide export system permease protein
LLDRYVLKRFGYIYAATLVSFSFLFILVDAVSNLERFLERTASAGELVGAMAASYAATLPVVFCQILGPAVAVSAALFTVTTMQRSNEFVPMLASGRSYQRALLPIVIASVAVSAGVFLVQELWVPRLGNQIRSAAVTRKGDEDYRNVKRVDEEGQLIVFGTYQSSRRRAERVIVLPAFARGGPEALISAAAAVWDGPEAGWRLQDGAIQRYDGGRLLHLPPSAVGRKADLYERFTERPLETSVIPQDIELGDEDTVSIPLGQLRRRAQGVFDRQSWVVKFWSRLFNPLSNFVLVLLGLPIIVYFGSRNVFVGALVAVGVSAAFFGVSSFFQELGSRGLLPPAVGAFLGPALFAALGATAYREMRS